MPKKSTEQFFDENIGFLTRDVEELAKICPSVYNNYHSYSLKKVLAYNYWVGIFMPIVHNNLRLKHGYSILFVDAMAGCGITKTKDDIYFMGSCTSIARRDRYGGFDYVMAIELSDERRRVLRSRLEYLNPGLEIDFGCDAQSVGLDIITDLRNRFRRYKSITIIDPQGFDGLEWNSLMGFMGCNGDAMITWFENLAYLVASEAIKENRESDTIDRIFGSSDWRNLWEDEIPDVDDFTNFFVNRILSCSNKCHHEMIDIEDANGKYYKVILFVQSEKSISQAREWKANLDKRTVNDIGTLLRKVLGKETDFGDFYQDLDSDEYVCRICNIRCNTKDKCEKHVLEKHYGYSFVCDTCGKKFEYKGGRGKKRCVNHIKEEHMGKEKKKNSLDDWVGGCKNEN